MSDFVPNQVIDHIRRKKLLLSFDYRDVWQREHAAAFTVAKAMQLDILQDIRGSVDEAIEQGMTFEQFRKDLQPSLQRKGWWGIRTMQDPLTGEVKDVKLGSPRRLKVIYDTNLRQANGAARWASIERNADIMPYLRYRLGPSKEHREEHLRFQYIVLHVSHPFWRTHLPINGWGCKCWVEQLTEEEALKYGITPDEALPTETRTYVNKRTGEVMTVPVGVSPEFAYNVGLSRNYGLDGMLAQKAQAIADVRSAQFVINHPLRRKFYRKQLQTWFADRDQFALENPERPTVSRGRSVALHALSRDALIQLDALDIRVPSIWFVDDKKLIGAKVTRKQAQGTALSDAEWLSLSDRLMGARQVFFNRENDALIYYLREDNHYIKVVMKQKGRFISTASRLSLENYFAEIGQAHVVRIDW